MKTNIYVIKNYFPLMTLFITSYEKNNEIKSDTLRLRATYKISKTFFFSNVA